MNGLPVDILGPTTILRARIPYEDMDMDMGCVAVGPPYRKITDISEITVGGWDPTGTQIMVWGIKKGEA